MINLKRVRARLSAYKKFFFCVIFHGWLGVCRRWWCCLSPKTVFFIMLYSYFRSINDNILNANCKIICLLLDPFAPYTHTVEIVSDIEFFFSSFFYLFTSKCRISLVVFFSRAQKCIKTLTICRTNRVSVSINLFALRVTI